MPSIPSTTNPVPLPQTLKGLTADQTLQIIEKSMESAQSVHYTVTSTGNSPQGLVNQIGDAGITDGVQINTNSIFTFTIDLIGGVAYVNGDQNSLLNSFGFSPQDAKAYSSKWIAILPNNSYYSNVAAAVSLGSLISNIIPFSSYNIVGPVVENGQDEYIISGDPSPSQLVSGETGQTSLYVSSISPYLPIKNVETITQGNSKFVSTAIFSNWGEPVNVSVPQNSVECSTIPSCP